LDAPGADTVISPLTLRAPFKGGSFRMSAETLTSVGVVPLAGLTMIQGWSLTAVHFSASPPVLVKRTCSSRNTQFRIDAGR
jgi:hypothetical protein